MWPMIAAAMAQQAIGGKQLGGMAPPPMMGGGGGFDPTMGRPPMMPQSAPQGGGIFGSIPQARQNLPGGMPKVNEKKPQEMTPEQPGGFGGFFNNLDSTLSSPSKTLGIGMLGQADPRLALAGLLASGFWNQR